MRPRRGSIERRGVMFRERKSAASAARKALNRPAAATGAPSAHETRRQIKQRNGSSQGRHVNFPD
jgi:hypothetical protein